MTRKTILLVEDNTIQREGLGVVLRQQGYNVLPTADGREALAQLGGGPAPDLILLDMLIPLANGDGWSFLAERKRNPALATIPVIIMTGLPIASRDWATSLGAAGLLQKPLEVDVLLAEVGRYLGVPGQA
jgi:CheY-like chemotaxis protein